MIVYCVRWNRSIMLICYVLNCNTNGATAMDSALWSSYLIGSADVNAGSMSKVPLPWDRMGRDVSPFHAIPCHATPRHATVMWHHTIALQNTHGRMPRTHADVDVVMSSLRTRGFLWSLYIYLYPYLYL